MTAGDLHHPVAALVAQGHRRRVEQHRIAIQHLGMMFRAQLRQRVRINAVVVQRHPHQAQAQLPGDGPQPRVGQRLAQHHVAGPGQVAEHRQQGALHPGAHQHPVLAHRQRAPLQPGHRRFAVLHGAAEFLVAHQRLKVRPQGAQPGFHALAQQRVAGFRRQVHGHVHRPVGAGAAAAGAARPAHEGALPDPRIDQTTALRLAVAPRHGGVVQLQGFGQIPQRWQALADPQPAGQDVVADGVGDTNIDWLAAVLENRSPGLLGRGHGLTPRHVAAPFRTDRNHPVHQCRSPGWAPPGALIGCPPAGGSRHHGIRRPLSHSDPDQSIISSIGWHIDCN